MATDEVLRDVVLGNRLATAEQVTDAEVWGAENHPTKDLAEVLFLRGAIDRTQVTLARRVAKMQRKRPSQRANKAAVAKPKAAVVKPKAAAGKPKASSLRAGQESHTPVVAPAASGTQARANEETKVLPSKSTGASAPARPPGSTPETMESVSASSQLRRGDPRRIGRYTLLSRIAKGGMGTVYKAQHAELERVFALKVLSERMANSKEALARFQREAKIAARLDHPNVVRVHDAGADGGYAYLVMDHVDGPDLDTVIEQEGVGVRKAAQITSCIAGALQHAHDQGIVHRDVKPDNILLDRRSGQPKITDFGIVKDLTEDADDVKLTRTGFTLGSPCYMSPEQARGKHDKVGVRSDIYSLCASLYEMLAGRPPFEGDAIHEIMVKVIETDPAEVRTVNPLIPVDLAAITMKGLEKDPARRYESADALSQDLQRFLAGDPVKAKPPGVKTKLRRAVRRNRTVLLLSTLIALVLAGMGLWSWQQERARAFELAEVQQVRVADALVLIRAAQQQTDVLDKRRGYLDALLKLEQVLLADPAHVEALAAKQQVILELGDHLINAGEATFAEFVFGLGQTVVDPAVIASRLQAARLGHWVEEARERERVGELREARRLYASGLEELQRAGFKANFLRLKLESLDAALERKRLEESVAELERLAEAAAARGDHLAAMGVYTQACELDPRNSDLPVKRSNQLRMVERELDELASQAVTARGAAQAALGSDSAPEAEARVAELLRTADEKLEAAKRQREQSEFGDARVLYAAAKFRFAEAASRATAIRAQARCEEAERAAEVLRAQSFAPSQFGNAREILIRGRKALEAGDYNEAVSLFESAASGFRTAGRTSAGKGDVSTARTAAQDARGELHREIGAQPKLVQYQSAEQDYRQAELHFSRQEYSLAKSLYERATTGFEELLAGKGPLLEAVGLREQVRRARSEALAADVERFAKRDFDSAVQAQTGGEAALKRGKFVEATDLLGKALYRFQLATRSSKPRQASMRQAEEARDAAEALRGKLREARLTWKPDYKEGERQFRDGQGFLDEGNFKSARRKFLRAASSFQRIDF